ncbi:hypothetical protein RJD39_22100 [Vibrio scophthalmi]|uniref:Uncharacterized protein n=1 Tax=Vibrio scophthalmi TaxID=45658 RepID=A0A1E3WGS3_9VIBR|nr:hypothetical protein [Vibrio scophthalmi]ODS04722.1 hypothetical protein VSF3289_03861 [Vibrio scophthalmi]ODS04730.1 hypothetical protein VSF3289_03869 [Vibrio scophthalmi]
MDLQYNVEKMDDNLKTAIQGLRRVRFQVEPQLKPYINYAVWVLVMLNRQKFRRGFAIVFYARYVMKGKLFKGFTDDDLKAIKTI